jgi:hypothetical protein
MRFLVELDHVTPVAPVTPDAAEGKIVSGVLVVGRIVLRFDVEAGYSAGNLGWSISAELALARSCRVPILPLTYLLALGDLRPLLRRRDPDYPHIESPYERLRASIVSRKRRNRHDRKHGGQEITQGPG